MNFRAASADRHALCSPKKQMRAVRVFITEGGPPRQGRDGPEKIVAEHLGSTAIRDLAERSAGGNGGG